MIAARNDAPTAGLPAARSTTRPRYQPTARSIGPGRAASPVAPGIFLSAPAEMSQACREASSSARCTVRVVGVRFGSASAWRSATALSAATAMPCP
ncbi:hypothetical protein ACFCWD_09785 [Streptomyces sp. NPDC056374]|uniref:hypothetical protein n=1 Tax=unclassified Streptomyces TaxID=2593676 RepID=UPI0035DDC9E2